MQRQTVNRNYKDSVFVDLFSEDEKAKDNFLSLYNALHDTNLNSAVNLKPLRLEQVMYMTFYNDVSSLVDNKVIILAEHQSTINPNMPLRCLEYVVRLYEQLYESREKYSRQLLQIPTPEFYVFYNGLELFPQEYTLKLSDAFICKTKTPCLELRVDVININNKTGHKLLERCQSIHQYSLFVDTVRKYTEKDPIRGFQKAITECIQNNILKEYLQRKTKEVINMLLAEYDYETDIAVQRAEERKIAFAEGIEQGYRQKALQDAGNFKQLGVSVDVIAQATGLTKKEIEQL